jgi:hypothetical protein
MLFSKIEAEYGVNINEISSKWGLEDKMIQEDEFLMQD